MCRDAALLHARPTDMAAGNIVYDWYGCACIAVANMSCVEIACNLHAVNAIPVQQSLTQSVFENEHYYQHKDAVQIL